MIRRLLLAASIAGMVAVFAAVVANGYPTDRDRWAAIACVVVFIACGGVGFRESPDD